MRERKEKEKGKIEEGEVVERGEFVGREGSLGKKKMNAEGGVGLSLVGL